jgi:hypothetical protein
VACGLFAACGDARRGGPEDAEPDTVQAAVGFAGSVGPPWSALPDFDSTGAWLDRAVIDWSTLEPPLAANRDALLASLGIRPLRDRVNEWQMQVSGDFHFVDFTGDGVLDVVYSGPTYWLYRDGEPVGAYTGDVTQELDGTEVWPLEGRTLVFYQTFDRHARAVFRHHGELSRVWRSGRSEPIAFRTVHAGCCGDPGLMIEYFAPAPVADTIRFERVHRIFDVEHAVPPAAERRLPQAQHFTVGRGGAVLRASPSAQDTPGPPAEGVGGNELARYGGGARGFALADATGADGALWWYVVMDGRTPPESATYDFGPEAHGDRAPQPDRVGWIDSRLVEPAARPPGR